MTESKIIAFPDKHMEKLPNAQLYEALAKAQVQMPKAKINRTNPHYRNNYADLASIMDSCKAVLSNNGLCIMQIINVEDGGVTYLITRLAHVSGEYIESKFLLNPEKNTLQGLGSALTYAKRYSLASLLGIVADEDDDGELACGEEIDKISSDQVSKLTNLLLGLSEKERASTLKAIGTNNLSEIKKDKFEAICRYLEKAAQKNGKEAENDNG